MPTYRWSSSFDHSFSWVAPFRGLFLAVGYSLVFLTAVPRHSFFNELIAAVMATIFYCSSVGLPQVFSSSRSRASYLFSGRAMRSSAMKVPLPS